MVQVVLADLLNRFPQRNRPHNFSPWFRLWVRRIVQQQDDPSNIPVDVFLLHQSHLYNDTLIQKGIFVTLNLNNRKPAMR